MIVRSTGSDKPQTPTDEDANTPDSNDKSQSKGVNSAVIVVAIVVPVIVVVLSAVILIACLIKRNRKTPYPGMKC
jgi:hypothetical protein